MQNKSIMLLVLILVSISFNSYESVSAKQTSKTRSKSPGRLEIAVIDIYTQQLDLLVENKQGTKRIFGEVYGKNNQSEWKEFRSEEALKDAEAGNSAFIWLKNGIPVFAGFTFQSGSGDWVQYANYYYRENGTLSKISATLNTFYGDMTVEQQLYYGELGKLISKSTKYLDMKTKQPKKPLEGFEDEELPIYQNIKALPFYQLLLKAKN